MPKNLPMSAITRLPRWLHALSTLGRARGTGARMVGWISAGLVLALIGTAMAFGIGAAGSAARTADSGAWLASSQRGALVHVNGSSGQVDGRVTLPGQVRGPLEVTQEGDTILVLDRATGVLTRIDPAQLMVAGSQQFPGAPLRLVAHEDQAWLVDEAAGTVQRIDPVTLAPAAPPIDLGQRPLGAARVDDAGVLWVLLPQRAEAVPVQDDAPGERVKVGEAGNALRLTTAAGRTAVIDLRAGTLAVLSAEGQGMTVRLPAALLRADPGKALVPEGSSGPLLPILAPDTATLVVANVESGVVQAAELDMARAGSYGAPQAQGSRVYIPDQSSGQVLVYDTATAKFIQPIRVTGVPGRLEVHSIGERVWINDERNATAAVVDEEGTVHLIDKYDTDVPAGQSPAPSTSPQSPPPGDPGPSPGGEPTDPDDQRPGTQSPDAPT
ncbi:MAG: hypothetical protein HOV68_25255, partial [Streptomycetaceae bacterium]|nr:hypothetical protein [Streptomycetaceae bacterium]